MIRQYSIGIAFAVTAALVGPVRAQSLWQAPAQPYGPPPAASRIYPFPAPTPSDAYRRGLINRWELEQYEGPTPQALQGPSPNGRGASGGGGS